MTSTPEDLQADLAACEAATAGPWYAGGPYPSVSVIVMVDGGSWSPGECPEPPLFEQICMLHQCGETVAPSPPECVANAELIARQRTRFPQVVRELIEARAEIERLRAMLKRWVSEPWGKREPSIREIIDMLRRLESDAPEWFRPQISNVLKMIIDGVAGE